MLYETATEMIGNTPLLRLHGIEEALGLKARLYGKIEALNPAGSVKDRVALSMIVEAERKGVLKTGATIVEPTSGNTGIGIAMVGVSRGYKVILTMPESMSIERRKLLKAYGAVIELTPASKGMKGAIEKANELLREIPGSVMLGQFDNPDNSLAHYKTTGPEIDKDLNGKIDIFVAGIGTGGTISGAGRYLKERNADLYVVGVEPSSSPFLSKGISGPHAIQGIGAGFAPSILEKELIDEIIMVENEDAFAYGRLMAKKEGILVGISSGAALCAGISVAKRGENEGKNIVIILPDSGDRYLSTALFEG